MKIFYFTATGNCLDIAKNIGGELISIPQVLKNNTTEFQDDIIGIVFPCYYFGTPMIVKHFLEKVKLNSSYIFAIMTYGNYCAAGTDHFEKIAKSCNIKVSYLSDIVMIDNYIPLFKMENQLNNEASKNIDKNINIIKSDINSKKYFIKKHSFDKKLMTTVAQIFYRKKHGTFDKKYSVEDSCTSCGICETVCPVGNITVTKKPEFNHNCTGCLACTHLCPVNAIRVAGEKSRVRFKNKNVSVAEIIKSNNQK